MIPRGISSRLCFAVALYLPTLLVLAHEPQPERSVRMAAWALCVIAIPSSVPRPWLRFFIGAAWITLPATLWWMGFAALNGIGPGWEAAQAVVATNIGETFEALRTVAGAHGFVAAAVAHIALLGLTTCLEFRHKPIARSGGAAPERMGGSGAIILAALAPLSVSATLTAFNPAAPDIFSSTDSLASPMGSYSLIAQMGLDEALYGDLLSDPIRRPAVESRKVTNPLLAVFIVGESVRDGGLGPGKTGRGPWTKSLDDRFRSGLGAWLPTTCAGSNGTHIAVPLMLTGLPPSEHKAARDAPSGMARLKSAGFATAWITNQDRTAFQEKGHDLYWSHPRSLSHDEVMIPIMKTFAGPFPGDDANSQRPRAVLLHMRGSHFEYVDRYPARMFASEPDGMAESELEELRYERSEEYSAAVLIQIADMLDHTAVPAFAVFSSDHGENLPSDRNGMLRHLGARTSVRDGTTTSLVFWNRPMAQIGKPAEVLQHVHDARMITHRDVWRIWMSLAGLDEHPVVPDPNPTIWASVDGRGYRVAHCSELKP